MGVGGCVGGGGGAWRGGGGGEGGGWKSGGADGERETGDALSMHGSQKK